MSVVSFTPHAAWTVDLHFTPCHLFQIDPRTIFPDANRSHFDDADLHLEFHQAAPFLYDRRARPLDEPKSLFLPRALAML